MKAKITARSELKRVTLTREYTFDILDDNDEIILASESIESRPSEIASRLAEIVTEYQAVFEDENDLDVGAEIV